MHLAQINVGHLLYPQNDPRIAEFMGALDRINALADGTDGFVWRLQSEAGNATDIAVPDEPGLIVNLSVWRDVESLFAYVYRSDHRAVMVKRRQWFRQPTGAYQALWWVAEGHVPTVAEGLARLRHLDTHGPTPFAFGFKSVFPPDAGASPVDLAPEPFCVGWS